MYNGSKYDFHLIIKNFASKFDSNNFDCFTMNENIKKLIKKPNRKHERLSNRSLNL